MVNECFTRAPNIHSILKIEKGDFFFFTVLGLWNSVLTRGRQALHH